jgi:hypothetical protein
MNQGTMRSQATLRYLYAENVVYNAFGVKSGKTWETDRKDASPTVDGKS